MQSNQFPVLFVLFLASLFAIQADARETPAGNSSPVLVKGQRISFDPRTSNRGKGSFFWAHGSVQVTLRGHERGYCVFDYRWEVEGAGNYEVHRIRVPIRSAPVVIDATQTGCGDPHHWSMVYTSFTRRQATLIRRHSFGHTEVFPERAGRIKP